MAEQSASHAKQVALAAQYETAADADAVLAKAVQDAHAATVAARERLDAIAAEIDGCARDPAAFAAVTPLGAHELQRFLIAKHRELISVVTEVQHDDVAKRALLESLRPQYAPSPATP